MAEKGPLRHPHFYDRRCCSSMVSLHLHLSATDWKYLETKDFWWFEVHGATPHGGNVDLRYLRQPSYGSPDFSHSLHYRTPNDERPLALEIGSAGSLYIESCVSLKSRLNVYSRANNAPVSLASEPPKSISPTATVFTAFSNPTGRTRLTTVSTTSKTTSPL